jgi:DNA-directed RNA polymerase I subunit RPA2
MTGKPSGRLVPFFLNASFLLPLQDGAPCGLLNHVTAACRIVTHYFNTKKLVPTLIGLGVIPHSEVNLIKTGEVGPIAAVQPSPWRPLTSPPPVKLYPVVVDGDFVGYLPVGRAFLAERQLRAMKVDLGDERVPSNTEIALISRSFDAATMTTQFPGLYVYTCPGRMIRPVNNLPFDTVEFIGRSL